MAIFKDITGQKFGRLTAIKRIEAPAHLKHRCVFWLCKCDCGNYVEVASHSLTSGDTKSCGCYCRQQARKTQLKHNGSYTRLYRIWRSMKCRCYEHNSNSYKYYGALGVEICVEWVHDFSAFQKWALTHGYENNLSIDRINTNDNYYPENCRWVDAKTQANNRRNNIYIEYDGHIKTLAEWANSTKINYQTLRARLFKHHWPVERALTC